MTSDYTLYDPNNQAQPNQWNSLDGQDYRPNPQTDRITSILQQRAQPIENTADQANTAGAAAIDYALAGLNRTSPQILHDFHQPTLDAQDRSVQSAQDLYNVFEQQRTLGNKAAQATSDAISKLTSDPNDQAKLLEYLHKLPENIDPHNQNQILMALARGKRDLGIKTDFERQQEIGALDLKLKQSQVTENEATAAMKKAQAEGGAGASKVWGDAQRLVLASQGTDHPLDLMTAYGIAKSGIGQGMTYSNGGIVPIQGAGTALETLSASKASGHEQGAALGKAKANLDDQIAMFPQIKTTVAKLHELGQKATYRHAGQTADAFWREVSGNATEGAKARTAYLAYVRDSLIPQLRQTFGAQFTENEGIRLETTLGDPNKSPKERDAALNAFLQEKFMSIQTGQRRVGAPVSPDSEGPMPVDSALPQVDGVSAGMTLPGGSPPAVDWQEFFKK